MPGLQLDPASYRGYLRYSRKRHLLVEGRDDKHVFELLLDELYLKKQQQNSRESIVIDTAENLIDLPSDLADNGNRARVEHVCESVDGKAYAQRLVCFVDREFREFRQTPTLKDLLSIHRVSGRLIWSRGHSIENYFFDFDTVRGPLRTFSVTEYFRNALDLLRVVFDQVIRLGCALSLASNDIDRLRLVRSSLSRDILAIKPVGSSEFVILNANTWKQNLVNRHKLDGQTAGMLVDRFRYWQNQVEVSTDLDVVRWMCHGHIGLSLIWVVYSKCVHEVCSRAGYGSEEAESVAQRVLRADETVRFNACADQWVQRALAGQSLYPSEVLTQLVL